MNSWRAGKGFTNLSRENVSIICWLLPRQILRPLLSLDIYCSAKCSRFQGSFPVSVTLLGAPVWYRAAAFSFALSSAALYAERLLALCLSVSVNL